MTSSNTIINSFDTRTETSFSVDEKLGFQKKEEHHIHTGEYGDGDCDGLRIQPQTKDTIEVSSVTGKDEDDIKQIFTRCTNSGSTNSYSSLNMNFSNSNNASPLGHWETDSQPRVKVMERGSFEILPSPIPLSTKELRDLSASSCSKIGSSRSNVVQCKADLSSSSLILRRVKRVFEKSVEIQNPTSLPYGFKVFCNRSALLHVAVRPKMGVVQPHGKIILRFQSKGSKTSTANDRIEIKTFGFFKKDSGNNIKDYYEKLLLQHPELIKTQNIERIILWDSGDLSMDLTKILDSIPNSRERQHVKKELLSARLDCQDTAKYFHPSKVIMSSVKHQLAITNQSLHESFHHISIIRHTQLLVMFLCVVFSIAIVSPIFTAEEMEAPEPCPVPEEELSFVEEVRKYFGI